MLDKVSVWLVLRVFLGFACAYCEWFFINSAQKRWRNAYLSRFLYVSLLFSPGMFSASTSLLPNTVSMYLYMLSFGFWMRGQRNAAVFFGALSVFVGVPFSGILLGFMALDVLWHNGVTAPVMAGILAVLIGLVSQILVDRYFYGKWVFALWNIVHYNALSSETDSTLYGVEPWTFYVKNLLLNLNFGFVFSILAIPLCLFWSPSQTAGKVAKVSPFARGAGKKSWDALIILSPFLWVGVLMMMPHKEQRFLYPVFPLLLLAGAFAFSALHAVLRALVRERAQMILVVLLLLAITGVGVSRVTAQTLYRGAPLRLWTRFSSEQSTQHATVCLGDEWHRFPSSFFLPSSARMEYIKGSFNGLLPKHFAPWPRSTSSVPSHMNDKNREESDRYVSTSQCDYVVVEQDRGKTWDDDDADVVLSFDIIDDGKSSLRAFYIPVLGQRKNSFKSYDLIKLRQRA